MYSTSNSKEVKNMKHYPVFSKQSENPNLVDYTPAIIECTQTALMSIIAGYRRTDFGYDSMYWAVKDIELFCKKYVLPNNASFAIDSGGYSGIIGDVSWHDYGKMIDTYLACLPALNHFSHMIFSLDLPINLKWTFYNTPQNVYKFNHQSLSKSKELLLETPTLRDKFFFIYQFRTAKRYEIWNQLYQDLNLKDVIKNWSLGGMVGLKSLSKIDFSPTIGIAYRSLFDYLTSSNPKDTFSLHFLGIYHKPERFLITFMEKLFAKYLEGFSTPNFTYDSINYIRQSQKLKTLKVFIFENETIISKDSLEIDENIINEIYFSPQLLKGIRQEIENRKAGDPLQNINAFAPFSVYSNLQLDKFFEYIIDSGEMIDIFYNCTILQQVEMEFTIILKNLGKQYPGIFTRQTINSIKKGLQICIEFHKWFKNKKDLASLNNLIFAFINLIGLEEDLK